MLFNGYLMIKAKTKDFRYTPLNQLFIRLIRNRVNKATRQLGMQQA